MGVWSALLLLLLTVACTPQPARVVEAGPDHGALDSTSEGVSAVVVTMDRPFGKEGEVPSHLTVGRTGQVYALTDQALYLLDSQGRVLRRGAWPVATRSSPAPMLVHTSRWDTVGPGFTARWAGDSSNAAGTYLVLADHQGSFGSKAMIKVSSSTGLARGVFDGTAHQVLWTSHLGGTLTLNVTGVTRATSSVAGTSVLASGLSSGTSVGGVVTSGGTLSLCTVDPGGAVSLRRFSGGKGLPVVKLTQPNRTATGTCGLATSGRSHLLAYHHAALPPAQVDWGVADPDLGPGTATYPVPMAQVVDPTGSPMEHPLRLAAQQGTVQLEDLLWDGTRYMVLINTVGYRGGRLLLVILDESGKLLGSHTIPLSYEPGRLVAARLAAAQSELLLLYGTHKPWDSGVLHLARLTVGR